MTMYKIQLHLISLSISSIQEDTYLLMLGQTDMERMLPVVLDFGEAQPLVAQINMDGDPFPFTDALCFQLASDYGVRVTEACIDDFSEGLFHAQVTVERDGDIHTYPVRLSDAVSLSMRASCPLYIDREIMDAACIDSHLIHQEGQQAGGAMPGTADLRDLIGRLSRFMSQDNFKNWLPDFSDEALTDALEFAVKEELYETASLIRDEQLRRKTCKQEKQEKQEKQNKQ